MSGQILEAWEDEVIPRTDNVLPHYQEQIHNVTAVRRKHQYL